MLKDFYMKLINGHYSQRIDHFLFYNNRLRYVIQKSKNIVRKLSLNNEYTVLNGVFKGLQYPSLKITESALVPKILGSYEYQLQPWFKKIITSNYTDIIDIGSAEGYYAVGLAKKMPQATIHCYDINEKDIDFSKRMAKVNSANNLTWNTFCNQQTLIDFPYRGKTLVICDCEGYEFELFSNTVISKCKNVDFLIELHDVINPIISSEILSRFQRTHTFDVVNNKDIDYSEIEDLKRLSPKEKKFALCEHRGGLYKNIFMEWVYLTSKEPL